MAQDFLSQLFGTPPDYSGSFTPPTQEQAQTSALSQGGLQALISLLGASGQTTRPISTGQVLGGALSAGLGGYQSSFDNTLRQMLAQGKLSDLQEVRAQRQRELAAYNTSQTNLAAVTAAYQLPTPQEQIAEFNRLGRPDLAKGIADSFAAVRKSGILRPPGEAEAPSPFAPFLASESPNIRNLAIELNKAFNTGSIDEETALKRIEPLTRMQESFDEKRKSEKEQKLTRDIAAGERAAKAAEGKKPTEGERKAAVLAGRLEGALADLKGATTAAQTPEFFPSLLQGKLLSFIPGSDIVASKITSSARERAEAAQLDALDAALTLGTGAAYTNEQLRGYAKAYFPQIGNDAATIADKNARFGRLVALAREQAGSAASSIDRAREKVKPFDIEAFKKENGLR